MYLLLLFLPVVLGLTIDTTNDTTVMELGEVRKQEISKDHTFKVYIHHSPSKTVPLSSIISIHSHATSEDNFSSVNIVAVSGRYSQAWNLANGERRLNTFCIDNHLSADHINVIVQLNDNYATSNVTRPKIKLELLLKFNEATMKIPSENPEFNVTDEMPFTFVVLSARPTSYHRENFVLTLKNLDVSAKNVCAVITIQPLECPLKNQANNFEAAVIYATMLEQATLTIRTKDYRSKDLNKFSEPFFVNIFLHPNVNHCTGGTAVTSQENRVKRLSASIKNGLPYSDYVIPIAAAVGFIGILVLISCSVLFSKQYDPGNDNDEVVLLERISSSNQSNGHTNRHDETVRSAEDFDLNDSRRVFIQGPDESLVETESNSDRIQQLYERCLDAPKIKSPKVEIGMKRLRKDATLEDMSGILKDDPWFRRNRSRVYLYLIPIVGLFYFIPAIQFAFLAKMNEESSGSLDLCYHNFGCSHPLYIFSDFNHVVSNMSFFLFGIAFVLIVKIKASKLAVHNNPKFDHISQRGIMQQLSIFYGMGVSLIFQALFSVCYHVCPTNLSLQFDTTMMYIICILVYIKIYQFRHPDVTPNAYSIMMMLGVLVFLEALVLHSTSMYVFGMFILLYIVMTIFVAFDCYYIGIGRLDIAIAIELAKEVFRCPFQITKKSGCVMFLKRFISHLIFCILNFLYAAYAVWDKYKNPDKSVSHVALHILAGNMIAYLLYYLYKKNRGYCRGEEFNIQADGSGQHKKCQFKIRLTAGSFFGLLALSFGAVGVYFYGSRNADRNLSAAESRNLNDECKILNFYDFHDLWHFFGAAGIFMAFSALLTIDDDLLNVPRNQIPVF